MHSYIGIHSTAAWKKRGVDARDRSLTISEVNRLSIYYHNIDIVVGEASLPIRMNVIAVGVFLLIFVP